MVVSLESQFARWHFARSWQERKYTSGERPKSGRIDFCVKRRDIVWITSTCGVQVGLKFCFKDETVQIGMSSVSGGCIIYF